MSNFKPGDLALVVGCLKDPRLIGSVVELFAPTSPGKFSPTPMGIEMCSAASEVGWVVLTEKELFGWGHVGARHLMPLRGEPDQLPAKKEERPVCAM